MQAAVHGVAKTQTRLGGWTITVHLTLKFCRTYHFEDFPGGSDGKESACNAGDPGLILRSGKSPGEGNGYHSSVLAWEIQWTEEPSAWGPWGRKELDTTEWHIFSYHSECGSFWTGHSLTSSDHFPKLLLSCLFWSLIVCCLFLNFQGGTRIWCFLPPPPFCWHHYIQVL